MADLHGRVALLVGSGTDIDVAVGTALASAGCRVTVWPTTSEDWVDRIEGVGADRIPGTARPESAHEAVQAARDLAGRLDILVQYQPTAQRGPVADLSLAGWSDDLDRLSSIFAVAQAFAAAAEPHAAIVHIASIDLAQAWPGRATASVVSNGLVGLSRAMAVEWAGKPIRVNVVAPGIVLDDDDRRAIAAGDRSLERVLLRAPGHRIGTAKETASLVRFLVGDQTDFITGQTIWVDGGWAALTQHAEGLRFP